eukprot:CAMPEP_0194026478 /NCGR_PEP_ID=MMETSP0009_2-20130614/765_1 /TAXON_ID=210454 /ORGANISM="Grammatophora oceanica, Strain CCMP 410" /LENGTH=175 /DNA_ID=CAMNT_0038665169 /DNA_START=76 /DNA_END=603 /DNA_ORIENTATION=+
MQRFVLLLVALLVGGASAFVPSTPRHVGSNTLTKQQQQEYHQPQPFTKGSKQSASSALNMRHRKKVKKLGKPADQRKALLRALTTEIIRHGRIKTTLVRARAVRKHVDHMITLGKRGDLHARRQALGWIYDKQLVHALFEAAPDRYSDRNGGYTRVLRTVARRGDNAKMAIIELV